MTMTKTQRSIAVATQLACQLSYRLGGAFRVEHKTIACVGGPDVESVSVVADRAGTWPLVCIALDGNAITYQLSDADMIKALGDRRAA